MMRKTIAAVVVLGLLAGGFFMWLKWSPDNFIDGYYLVPDDAVWVMETEDPVGSWQHFSASELWQGIKGYPPFSKITEKADFLDEVIRTNQQVFSLIGKKHLLISLHMTKTYDFDFVYYADLKEASKSDLIKASLTSLIRQFDYKQTVREYNGIEVNEYLDPESRDVLSVAFIGNYLVCTYNKQLLNKVIETSAAPALQTGMKPQFTEVNRLTSSEGLCRIFVNYKTLGSYLKIYMEDMSVVEPLFAGMYYTGFDAKLQEQTFTADGYTMLNDSLSSWLQALSVTGSGNPSSEKIFSDRTAFCLSLSFPDFNTFYGNLEKKLIASQDSYKEQQDAMRKIEKRLGISFRSNLFDWIGEEIALAQYENDLPPGIRSGSVLAIRATEIGKARENLEYIEKQIRKRTPVKFTSVEYNGYTIRYLEIKGLFRAFLGKFFSKLDKPYYAILDDYVVFSDQPRALLQTIDDFRTQKTLSNLPEYRSFRSGFPDKYSAMVFINPDRYFPSFKTLLKPESYKTTLENQAYIRCFGNSALCMTGDGERMRTVFSTNYSKWKPVEVKEDTTDFESDSLSFLDLFLITHFQDNLNTRYFDNGNPSVTAEMSGNIYHGAYAEYYENGVVKLRGRYRNGVKHGIWKYYKPDGTFDYREKYVDGVLKKPGLLERIFGDKEE